MTDHSLMVCPISQRWEIYVGQIERAARALCLSRHDDPDEWVVRVDGPDLTRWQIEERRVRVVLAEIFEPSENMKRAGGATGAVLDWENPGDAPDNAAHIWQAMLAALIAIDVA